MHCDNSALSKLCKAVPSEYRYLDSTGTAKLNVPIFFAGDADAYLFLSSVLRTQLEVNALLKKNVRHSKQTRACFSEWKKMGMVKFSQILFIIGVFSNFKFPYLTSSLLGVDYFAVN